MCSGQLPLMKKLNEDQGFWNIVYLVLLNFGYVLTILKNHESELWVVEALISYLSTFNQCQIS